MRRFHSQCRAARVSLTLPPEMSAIAKPFSVEGQLSAVAHLPKHGADSRQRYDEREPRAGGSQVRKGGIMGGDLADGMVGQEGAHHPSLAERGGRSVPPSHHGGELEVAIPGPSGLPFDDTYPAVRTPVRLARGML